MKNRELEQTKEHLENIANEFSLGGSEVRRQRAFGRLCDFCAMLLDRIDTLEKKVEM